MPSVPTVTIGLPVHNAGAYLLDCIASIWNQTYRDWQVILIDDGSTDGWVDKISVLEDERLSVVRRSTAVGLARTLNEIASLAQGEILVRMDQDDIMHTERVERLVAHLTANPAVDVTSSRAYLIDERTRLMGLYAESPGVGDARSALRNVPFAHSTVAGRTSWFRENPYTPKYSRAEDKELWLRTIRASKFSKIPEPLLYYRIHSKYGNSKYRIKCQDDRGLIREYGPELVSRFKLAELLAESYIKEGVYGFARRSSVIGSALQRRRVGAMSEIDQQVANRYLSEALADGAPGNDGVLGV